MKVRRQHGGTLGLVAACVFLVIIVGVGFYFLSKIIGGGREVANATDAGALNVAKHAIRRGAVALTLNGSDAAEFGGLVDPGSTANSIDLLTYNRMVAQAIIVAKNAEEEGTAGAQANAKNVMDRVKAYGAQLRNNLDTNAYVTLGGDFSNLANRNNTKMWNGNQATLPDAAALKAGYMKQGASTNVWIPAAVKAGWSSPIASLETTQSSAQDPASKYIAGYQKFQINLGASGVQDIYGVPVLPQNKTHLADNAKFNTANYDAAGMTPPNSWQTKSQAVEAKSGAIGGAVSCAIVGVIDKEFQASVPRGFVRVLNNASADQVNGSPAGVPVADGQNDIFNNELFVPTHPGVFQSNNNVVSSDNSAGLNAWAAYNATTLGQPGHNVAWDDPVANPLTAGHGGGDPSLWTANSLGSYLSGDMGLYYHYSATPARQPAQEAELRGISSVPTYCNHTMYDDNTASTHPECLTSLNNWTDIFGRQLSGGTAGGPYGADGLTNVEFMKADLLGKIAGRLGGSYCASIGYGLQPSGLKAWKDKSGNNAFGKGMPYAPGYPHGAGANAQAKVNYLVTGSPAELINQMPNCVAANVYDSITARLKQVKSDITQADVQAAMGSVKLDLGPSNFNVTRTYGTPVNGRLYVYVDAGTVKMSSAMPWSDLNMIADGANAGGGAKHCTMNYPLNGWAVNTEKGYNGSPIGDGGYHEQPFTTIDAGNPTAVDNAYWQESSGAANLLGELRFEQTVTGARFCKPN